MSETTDTTSTSVKYDAFEGDGNDRHALQTYVSDLLALITHIEVPVKQQLNVDDTSEYAQAFAIINEIKDVTASQRTALELHLEKLGGHPASGIKSAWSAFLGAGAAAIDSTRKTKVSKSLRDDYTALSLASISYTMLHATALGLGDESVAGLAEQHLSQLAPLVIRISTAIPLVVLQELKDDGENVRVSAAELSTRITHAAWQPAK